MVNKENVREEIMTEFQKILEELKPYENKWCNQLSADIVKLPNGFLIRDYDSDTDKITGTIFVHEETTAKDVVEIIEIDKCPKCESINLKPSFIEKGTCMGIGKFPEELFRKSEYDFGWDYYPKVDILEITCTDCKAKHYKPAGKAT